MLGLGDQPTAAAPEGIIIDGTDASFAADVIEASQTVPVIVDFWATWCGPCKTLGPAIEAAVTKAGGRVKLVKIDVDQNQAYASQLQVQSIPTVYAFWKGQPVDGFQGALPASQLDEFVTKVANLAGEPDNGLDDAVAAAEEMLASGEAADAAETFAAILQEEPAHAAAYGGLVRSHIAIGDLDQAEAVLNGAPVEIAEATEVEAARAQLDLARQASAAGPIHRTSRPVSISPSPCTPMAIPKRPSMSSWLCSSWTANGMTRPPRHSSSPFSTPCRRKTLSYWPGGASCLRSYLPDKQIGLVSLA